MASLLPWKKGRERTSPLRELGRWHDEIDEMFSRLYGRPLIETDFGTAPAIESFVRNGDLVVRADLPGIDPKDVEINVLGDVLTIKGERHEKKEVKEDDYIRREVAYGSFQRQFTLPHGVDAEKIRAKYENGVLEVTMPAPKELSPKKVAVNVAKS